MTPRMLRRGLLSERSCRYTATLALLVNQPQLKHIIPFLSESIMSAQRVSMLKENKRNLSVLSFILKQKIHLLLNVHGFPDIIYWMLH